MRLSKSLLKLAGHGTFLVVLIAVGAVAPATALDFNHGQNDFCASLEARTKRVDAGLAVSQAQVRQAWQQQNDRMRVMSSEQQSSRIDSSAAIDAQRTNNLRELRQHATSAVQRAAIDDYKSTQAQAIALRRTAVGQADDAFTAAIKRLVANRQATQAGQVEALRIALDDSLRTASGECAAGVEPSTVSHDFATATNTSRQTFMAQRKSDGAISAQVTALSQKRRLAVSAANQVYLTTMIQARQNLQAALK